MNDSILELQAKVKAAQEANAAKIAEAAIKASLEATLKLEASETLFESKVKLAVTGGHTTKLQTLVDECAAIIESIPVTNPKSRAVREWAGSNRFAFGTQINLMYQLATGILYSCAEHKALLLEHTGLNLELIEQFVNAFGSPSYYSRNFHTIVEAKMYDVDAVLSTVTVMQSTLGVIVDTSLLTAEEFSLEFGKAETVAYDNKVKADEALAEADLKI